MLEIEQAVWDAFADAAAARERGEQLLLVAFRAGVPVKRLVALAEQRTFLPAAS